MSRDSWCVARGCGEGVRLFADSRFGVRETGFSESWFGSALLSKGAIHPSGLPPFFEPTLMRVE